ncbi:MAG: phosphoribosylamine--glycine ligase [Chthonomonadales bacterium]
MRILVVGNGGREHALVWKLAQSPHAERIYCAPGNAGIAQLAECINLKATDLDGLANFAATQKIDLTVVGPEAPLIAGIVDRFEARGLRIFGPSTDPARIEGSKIFAKELMTRYSIPTAAFWRCDTPGEAHQHIHAYFSEHPEPGARLVIKADGAAAGKGVIIAAGEDEAHCVADDMMVRRVFGAAGERIVLEEYLEGEEASIMAFTDGETVVPMPPSQDHKRALDNDEGPNTGGMGAYTPVPVIPPTTVDTVLQTVLCPAVQAIRDLGIPYKGVLYAGIIVTPHGVRTLEFNCRFGDPETQAVLPLLESDLIEIMDAVVNSSLEGLDIRWRSAASVNVVAASGGYPDRYETGKPITGLDDACRDDPEDCMVFHAGTREDDGIIVTAGGRVLGVTALGADLRQAVDRAYRALGRIHFEGMHYRHDIAARALKHLGGD